VAAGQVISAAAPTTCGHRWCPAGAVAGGRSGASGNGAARAESGTGVAAVARTAPRHRIRRVGRARRVCRVGRGGFAAITRTPASCWPSIPARRPRPVGEADTAPRLCIGSTMAGWPRQQELGVDRHG
jgi:hypothetical protein